MARGDHAPLPADSCQLPLFGPRSSPWAATAERKCPFSYFVLIFQRSQNNFFVWFFVSLFGFFFVSLFGLFLFSFGLVQVGVFFCNLFSF